MTFTQFLQKFIQMYLLVLCMHINITTTCSKICFQHMLLDIFFDAMFTEKQTYHKWIFLMDMTMCSNHILLPVAGLCCTNYFALIKRLYLKDKIYMSFSYCL